MPIIVTCQCGHNLKFRSERAGKKGKCPACGWVMTIPGEPRPGGSLPPQSPRPKRYRCVECGDLFQAAGVVKREGRIICKRCSQPAAPAKQTFAKAKKITLSVGVVVALTIIIVVIGAFLAPGDSTESVAEYTPLASADRSVVETDDETSVDAEPVEQDEDTSPREQDLSLSQSKSDKPSVKRKDVGISPQARSSTDLLSTFMDSISLWDELYWQYQPSDSDELITKKLFANKRLVGDGIHRDVRYPPAGFFGGGLLGFVGNSQRGSQRTANLSLYVGGQGISREALKKELGSPRIETNIESIDYVIYGYTSVLYGPEDEFLGIVRFYPMDSDEQLVKRSPAPADDSFGKQYEDSKDPQETITAADDPLQLEDTVAMQTEDSLVLQEADLPSETASDEGDRTVPNVAGEKFRLKYKRTRNIKDPLVSKASLWVHMSEQKPSHLKKLPRRLGQNYMHFMAPLGGQNVCVVLQYAQKAKLYVDTDLDDDLSDEKPVTGIMMKQASKKRLPTYQFSGIQIPAPYADGRKAIELIVEADGYGSLQIYPAGFCYGKARLGSESYLIAVVDADFDGRYDGVYSLSGSRRHGSDYLGIDFNCDRQFQCRHMSQMELQPLTEIVGIKDAYYSVNVAPDGSAVHMAEVKPQFGTFDTGKPGAELLLYSDSGAHYLDGSQTKWKLPVGKYLCGAIALNQTDRRTSRWSLESNGNTGQLKKFDIQEGKILSVKLGSPLTIKTNVRTKRSRSPEKIISIGVTVRDQVGVEYTPGATLNGKLQPAPKVRIFDPSGKVLVVGKFEYG